MSTANKAPSLFQIPWFLFRVLLTSAASLICLTRLAWSIDLANTLVWLVWTGSVALCFAHNDYLEVSAARLRQAAAKANPGFLNDTFVSKYNIWARQGDPIH